MVVSSATRSGRALYAPPGVACGSKRNGGPDMQAQAHLRVGALLASALAVVVAGCATTPSPEVEARRTAGLKQIEHIVVIYAENRSFDHLYGTFPGADGIKQATAEQTIQLDHDGTPLKTLPPVYVGGKPSDKFPTGLPNAPFRIDAPP